MKASRMIPAACCMIGLGLCTMTPAESKGAPSFKTQRLSDKFHCEGAHLADLNKDGKMDIVAGPYWYEGPDYGKHHEFYPAKEVDPHGYSQHFFTFTHDFNGDGWTDILVLGFPGAESWWFQNPGPSSAQTHWPRHVAMKVTDNESPTFTDLTGDGKPEIVCSVNGYFGYAVPSPSDPTQPFIFHKISDPSAGGKFTHGLGVGDVNGDGRMDLLEKSAWWEQPASLSGDPVWVKHPFTFSPVGGAQMYAYDVDGDGDNDVITSLAAHGYGLVWYEQIRKDGQVTFQDHLIVGSKSEDNPFGVKFSQLHALEIADINGDGFKDIITGKRWWAHGPKGDVEPDAPAVLYWFELSRKEGKARFIPHLVHDDSGIGTQVVTGDVNGDGKPDIVVGNKKGTFVHIQQK